MSSTDDTETTGFLARWSRRKHAREREDDQDRAPQAPSEHDPQAPVEAEGAEEAGEPRALTDDDMPPVESLDASSDVSGFMSPGVSEALRRRALRHIFRSAFYQRRDGLDDYDGDYTNFTPRGDLVTADMRYHRERLERLEQERLAAAEESGAVDEPASGSEDDAERDEDETVAGRESDADDAAEAPEDDPPPRT